VSFQAFFAVVPMLLAGAAVLGFLELEEVWGEELAPRVQDRVSSAVYAVIERSVASVLGTQRGFWLTLGAGLALWELSGAVRATMGALNEIYGIGERRPFIRRLGVSIALAVTLAVLLGLAATGLQVVPNVVDAVGLGRIAPLAVGSAWLLAAVLIVLAVAVMMRFGPAVPQTTRWFGLSTLLVIVGWSIASIAFGAYVTRLATYRSIYGGLGVVILVLTYLYISALVFLSAAQVDAFVRRYAGEAR
jgi:membrane protein